MKTLLYQHKKTPHDGGIICVVCRDRIIDETPVKFYSQQLKGHVYLCSKCILTASGNSGLVYKCRGCGELYNSTHDKPVSIEIGTKYCSKCIYCFEESMYEMQMYESLIAEERYGDTFKK